MPYICLNSNILKKLLLYCLISFLTLSFTLECTSFLSKLKQSDTIDLCLDGESSTEDGECDDKSESKVKLYVESDARNFEYSAKTPDPRSTIRVRNEDRFVVLVHMPVPFTPPDIA